MSRVRAFLLPLSFLILTSCISPKYISPPPERDAGTMRDSLMERLDSFPDEFKISQHIILKVGGREYDLIGYMAMDGTGRFRALAFGEMGGKLFDLMRDESNMTVLLKPEKFPSAPLKDGVMGDISHIFRPALNKDAYLAGHTDDRVSLVDAQSDGKLLEYIFSGDNLLLTNSIEVFKGKILREAEYLEYRHFPDLNRPVPSRIILRNHRWGYSFTVELLKIDTGRIEERVFSLH